MTQPGLVSSWKRDEEMRHMSFVKLDESWVVESFGALEELLGAGLILAEQNPAPTTPAKLCLDTGQLDPHVYSIHLTL